MKDKLDILYTLHKLQEQVSLAVLMVDSLVEDKNITSEPFDFIIGDFGVKIIRSKEVYFND